MIDFLFLETPIKKEHDFYWKDYTRTLIGNSTSTPLTVSVNVTLSNF